MSSLSKITFAIVILMSSFQVNGMVGARTKVLDVKSNNKIQEIGRYSVDEYNRLRHSKMTNADEGLRFSQVVEAEKQVVSGMKYYLKIEALSKTSHGDPEVFEAVVVVKPWIRSKQLVKFAPSPLILQPVS
ncbi:hypothetical protein QVD17_15030 [Tagetes erecta]|uniref:Cystatin domain-containing protein n=1 Tax=Tagetes erecta TaxID=13708 RepID=A0AAD8KNK4_TARER|nr:hypothetical protein QVD17_15030 [Tagetes erecta]